MVGVLVPQVGDFTIDHIINNLWMFDPGMLGTITKTNCTKQCRVAECEDLRKDQGGNLQ